MGQVTQIVFDGYNGYIENFTFQNQPNYRT